MPLLTFDVIEGRSPAELQTLLDAAHRAVLSAFAVPERDRYQIVHENKAHQMVIEDTGLGLTRSRNLVVVRVFTSPRSEQQKQRFYAELQRELKENCGIEGGDLMVSIVTNAKGDWSFGNGVAQYLTGEL
ncbi:Tautomerase enzyme [Serratia ficaria]|uniref:tautomerase family protein n=1 Tax=Serratia ficaria TaxID=61651 RepID=UPI00217C2959|nr:tautomerase family protein [Serratia ficaria]CAI1937357.1 Tautomerase enzyme [Serratia ficaria]CAI2464284.1 Tautomerase enzyme [Serratia ficaria]